MTLKYRAVYDLYTISTYTDLWQKLLNGHPDFDTINYYTDKNYISFSRYNASPSSSVFTSYPNEDNAQKPPLLISDFLVPFFDMTGLRIAETKSFSSTLAVKRKDEYLYQVKLKIYLSRICYKNFSCWINMQTDIQEIQNASDNGKSDLKYAYHVNKTDSSVTSDFQFSHWLTVKKEQPDDKSSFSFPVTIIIDKLSISKKGDLLINDQTPFHLKVNSKYQDDWQFTCEYSEFKEDK